eukprot:CAMPEP_0170294796 /NCGR_PEP_ID=MMETSP0116_2-20130129/47517_1 /TAXON_ID=400756 /ORGANISM="Durinskia baltica, Strain CSIRO CS-38" /LENGTH=33 /DNA_ID= /DNA_START= /DNA_END= /DNA_ORIENTATION=
METGMAVRAAQEAEVDKTCGDRRNLTWTQNGYD